MKRMIEKHGEPSAIIFSKNINKYNVIWGFDDIFTITNNDLSNIDILNDLQNQLNLWKETSDDIAAIGYLSYDAKQLFYQNLDFKKSNSSLPIAWFAKPKIIKSIPRNKIHDFYAKSCYLKKTKELINDEIYNDKINIIKKYLKAGDVYQINFTQPIKYQYKDCSPLQLFGTLSKFDNPNFGAYIDINSHQIISLSPENFLKKDKNCISSSPIKGTRKRSKNKDEDVRLINELKQSEKDKAEHLMIVDLIRNDLGKICKFGSVKTENLFKIHSFKTIHHMISDIIGKINKNIQEIDIFRALFPGGSITGAPKQRAIEIIDEIEQYKRGIYTGSIGYISNKGDMNFNISIRTLTINKNHIIYPVGGGIVWDSISKDERKEAIYKSKVMNI